MNLAFKTLFSKAERFLIRNNRTFVIKASESDGFKGNDDQDETALNEDLGKRYYDLLDETGLPRTLVDGVPIETSPNALQFNTRVQMHQRPKG